MPYSFGNPALSGPIAGRAVFDAPIGGNLLLVMPRATPPTPGGALDSGEAGFLSLTFTALQAYPDASAFSGSFAAGAVLGTCYDELEVLGGGGRVVGGNYASAAISSSPMMAGVALAIRRGFLGSGECLDGVTILGALVEPHRALVWTDSETFAAGRPSGFRPKLTVNVLAKSVLVSTGSTALLRTADEAAWRGSTYDEIAVSISAALRRRAGAVANDLTRRDPCWLPGQTVALVGWSESAGRMLATTFSGAGFFEPTLAARLVLPRPIDVPMPTSMPELVAFARRQVACLRDTFPDATGGSLQVAELLPDRIVCTTVPAWRVRSRSSNDDPADLTVASPTAADIAAKRLCLDCVGEAHLKGEIKAKGKRLKCSYCGKVARSFSIEEMADRVEQVFKEHYTRTPDEPDGLEAMMQSNEELDYEWEREGEPVIWAIMDAADIPEAAAEDIQSMLGDRHAPTDPSDYLGETEFSSDSYYEQNEADASAWRLEWEDFESSLKTQARFFSRTAVRLLRNQPAKNAGRSSSHSESWPWPELAHALPRPRLSIRRKPW